MDMVWNGKHPSNMYISTWVNVQVYHSDVGTLERGRARENRSVFRIDCLINSGRSILMLSLFLYHVQCLPCPILNKVSSIGFSFRK